MATKTYSEVAQAVLFKASRDMRKVAESVLDDVVNRVELTSDATHQWARQTAARYAERANELENQAHELTVATVRQENELYRSHKSYNEAIDRYEERRKSAALLSE